MGDYAIWIAIAAALLGGVFSSLKLALTLVTRSEVELLANSRNRPSATRRVQIMLDDAEAHARAVAAPRLLCNLVAAFAVLWWILTLMGATGADPAGTAGEPSPALELVPALIATGAAGALLWLTTIIIPNSIALHAGPRLLYVASPLVRGVALIERPLWPVIRVLDEIIRRLAGGERLDKSAELEREIMSVLEEGEREGSLDETERDMIEAVVQFRSTAASQIMTPRTEIDALEATDDLDAIVAFIERIGHSRVPVFEADKDLDHVVGILYAKDLLGFVSNGSEEFRLADVVRPALFIPETKTIRELMGELIEKKVHLAVVADEYGGTAGLVTIEDIVEEVFGDIQDEYEPEEDAPPGVSIDAANRSARADARVHIDDLNDELEDLGVELPESDDYDTLGGFVVTTLGRIPDPGESLRHERLLLNVTDATPTRVKTVQIEVLENDDDTPLPPPPSDEPGPDASPRAESKSENGSHPAS